MKITRGSSKQGLDEVLRDLADGHPTLCATIKIATGEMDVRIFNAPSKSLLMIIGEAIQETIDGYPEDLSTQKVEGHA